MNLFAKQNRRWQIILLSAAAVMAVFFAWTKQTHAPAGPALRVLFVGNSYTQANSLQNIFAEIAASAGFSRPVVNSYTPGGQTFMGHLADPQVKTLLADGPAAGEHWDAVVLQEQSEVPAAAQMNQAVKQSFLDGAVGLYKEIRDTNPNARVILYETWARYPDWWTSGNAVVSRDGQNAADMMSKLKAGYEQAAEAMSKTDGKPVPIARVGELWEKNYNSASPVRLHSDDNSHPDYYGSYIAALDIFATVYNVSPSLTTYSGGMAKSDADQLKNLVSKNFPNIAP